MILSLLPEVLAKSDPALLGLVVTGAVSVLVALLGGGAGVNWLLRKQRARLQETEQLLNKADAASKLASASVAEVEIYRRAAAEYMARVETLHSDLLDTKAEIAALKIDLARTARRLEDTLAALTEAKGELDETHQHLRSLQASHSASQRELDGVSERLREAEIHWRACQEDKASLEVELTALRARLENFGKRECESGGSDGE